MIYYVIRHKKTGELMPLVKTRGGYSHWNPDNLDMPKKIFFNIPRILESKRQASQCIAQWFSCQNGRNRYCQDFDGNYDSFVDFKPDNRKKEDLEVVEVNIIIKEKE